jgi:hypothetical protein
LRKLPRYYGISISENYGCPCPVLKFVFSIHQKVMLSQWITPKVLEIKWKHKASQLLKGREKSMHSWPPFQSRESVSHLQKEGKVIFTLPSCLLPWWLDFASFLSFGSRKQLGQIAYESILPRVVFFSIK